MSTQADLPPAKQPSISRKSIGRKAVAAPTQQKDHVSAFEPFGSDLTSALRQPNNLPCELPGSPVPLRTAPSRSASSSAHTIDATLPSTPQSVSASTGPSSHAATAAVAGRTESNGQTKGHEMPVPDCLQQESARSDSHVGRVGPGEAPSTTTQSKTNQARRMQRRTMMMAVTANVGTTQSRDEPQSLDGHLQQPGYGTSAAPPSPAPFPQPGSPSQIAHSLQARAPVQRGPSMPLPSSYHTAPQVQPWMSAQPSLSPSLFACPSTPIQNSTTSMQNSALPRRAVVQTMQSTNVAHSTLPGPQNQTAQRSQIDTGRQTAPLPAASIRSHTQPTFSPSFASSSVQSRPPAQRSMSIQSAQTVSSMTSPGSGPNSASSVGSPITTVTTPGTVYSPLSQASQPLHKPFASASATSVSYFSLCNSCKIGT